MNGYKRQKWKAMLDLSRGLWFSDWLKLCLACFCLVQSINSLEIKEYHATFDKDNKDILCRFRNLEYDTGNDKLYVGAVNFVYQLNADVVCEKSAKTGPQQDNGRCYPHSPCALTTVKTNNFNKLLKIDYDNKRILACGSIREGICELCELGNVTHVLNKFDRDNDRRGNDFVASTGLDQSTVAFIANEGDAGHEKLLYVGTSRTVDDSELAADADHFMTFTSRKMPKNNMDTAMLSTDIDRTVVGLLTKTSWSAEGFRVNFISAFEGNQNGYFVLNYPEFVKGQFRKDNVTSYVAQVCLRKENSPESTTTSSYFEIPISALSWLGGRETELRTVIASTTAKVGGELEQNLGIVNIAGGKNPDVLFASFATDGGSVISMFPLFELDTIYYEMARSCINGEKMNHVQWQSEKEVPCKDILMTIKEPLCGNDDIWDVLSLLQSKFVKHGYTIFESNDTIVTSLAVTKLADHTVVFMGTQNGRLLKLKIDSKPTGNHLPQPYDEIQIDSNSDNHKWQNMGSPTILPNMRLNNKLTRLYVMSERKLVSLPLYDCAKHQTCIDCLSTGDPFCGWCTLDDRCTAADQCAQGRYTYATSEPGNCPKLDDTDPVALAVTDSSQTIKINVKNVPNPEVRGQYSCDFGGKYRSDARLKGSYVICTTPKQSKMPKLNGQEVSVPLSLYFRKLDGDEQTMIASTEIVFYDCANFKSCQPCLFESGKFRCHWCTNDNQCVSVGNSCQTNPGDVIDQSDCPQLLRVIKPPHLHVGERESVKLQAEHLPSISSALHQGFKCQFHISDKEKRIVNATHTRNTIICNSIEGFLPPGVYEAEARISVFWNRNFLVDNPKNLNVTMYQCSHAQEDNCGQCLLLNQNLKCGYCEAEKKCTLCSKCPRAQCSDRGGLYRGWLDQDQDCREPKITNFEPKSAAPGGVTKITIEGTNLGRDYERLEGGITVSGEPCRVLSERYKKSERVVCEVRSVREEKKDPVTLCIQEYGARRCKGPEYTATSSQNFEFISPHLESFTPKQGLYAGGTRIKFEGKNLDIGNKISVSINGRSCPVTEGSVKMDSFSCVLSCDTSSRPRTRRHSLDNYHHPFHRPGTSRRSHRSKRSISGRVMVVFDEKEVYYQDVFSMEKNVKFNSLSPKESIASGGMKLTVTGINLHLAHTMVLKVTSGKLTAARECEGPGEDKFKRYCFSPVIRDYDSNKSNYTAEVVLDSCLTMPVGYIQYTGNPFLNQLEAPDHVLHHQSGPIIITGRNLCPNPVNCDAKSVKVKIGDSLQCNVTNLDRDKLVCVPPEGAGGSHKVVVFIGDYKQSVGELAFDSGSPSFVFIFIAIVLIAILVLVIVCVYRKRDKNSQTVRQLQMQLDMMEAKVAKECKEAFAELQTDMQSDLENLGSVGIPFRRRQDYVMRVLFPDPDMYEKLNQTMHMPYDVNSRFNHHNGRGAPHRTGCLALESFDKLLESKAFLLTFIKTLEGQRKFSMKDKGNVAALLMIVLQNRLQYATDILENLLADLIRSNMESSSHPKLLLRRTESVAEKMLTHWFSILLYSFLMECAGEPLFMLFRAIKAQLDKGPIDAITGEAKYSLSEDKLLRQAVAYEQLVLIVIENDGNDQPGQVTPVKVLDCDTISQTKEKIIAVKHRNQPLSQHPDSTDFDLEMDQDPLLRAVLNDEDNTSVVEGAWKRINTLIHYKVKDRTRVAMVPKKIGGPFNQSINSNHSFGAKVGGMRYNGSGHRLINDGAGSLPRHMAQMQGSRSTTPTIIDDGKKLYHLAKHHDAEQKDGASDLGNKMASEIYLTRLLATKGTIQKFVDDLFETIFSVVQRGHALPLAIKHMFDFLDDQAAYHGVVDPDVVHAWKSNCLPLRFWVNLIKNPQFLFDIKKTALIDSCLTVIGQTFMDSCSKSDHVLGKDSPSNKLLYAKDIPNYKQWVERYYSEISSMEPLNPTDMQCFLEDESSMYKNNLNSQAALTQLYLYVQKYSNEIIEALNHDPAARSQRLAQRLEQVATTMTSTV